MDKVIDSVPYLKASLCLIAPDSGFIDFAKNCECCNIIILLNQKMDIGKSGHSKFNPFGSNVLFYDIYDKIFKSDNILDSIDEMFNRNQNL